MSGAQHTPGPWTAREAVDGYYADMNIVRPDGLAVAVSVMNGNITRAETAANARLIASAPDLLTRLERSNAIIRARFLGRGAAGGSCGLCHSTWLGEIEDHYEGCCIVLNDILIAKARGA